VFFITGAALIGLGSYMQIHMKNYFDFLGDTGFVNTSIFIIIIGVVVALISFFGCCGACTKNACMMHTFGSFMLGIVLIEIGLGVTVYFYKDQTEAAILNSMKEGMNNYQPDNVEYMGVVNAWDNLQESYQCCGIESYTDWKNATEFSQGRDVPDSCCQTELQNCGKNKLIDGQTETIYTTGCVSKFYTDMEENTALAGGVGAALGIIQLATCIIAFALGCRMRKYFQSNVNKMLLMFILFIMQCCVVYLNNNAFHLIFRKIC
jgi:glucan phosphoethanolaminetransferase (alkaline phosphatase superfamily)